MGWLLRWWRNVLQEEPAMSAPVVSPYPPWDMERLARVEAALVPALKLVTNSYVGERMDARTPQALRFELRHTVDSAFRREGVDHVRWYLLVESDLLGNVPVYLSVPAFKHDCDLCAFLGHAKDEDDKLFDLYTCDKAGYRTYIARFGSDGPQYLSGPVASAAVLTECRRRSELP